IGDPTGTITRNFEVMREDQGLADRGTFVIDPDGVIQAMEITAEGIGRDAGDLLRKVKAAQYVAAHPGEVCPARGKEGDKTLTPSRALVGKIRPPPRGPQEAAARNPSRAVMAARDTSLPLPSGAHAMLDADLKAQLAAYMEKLTQPIELVASLDDSEASRELSELLREIAATSDKISLREGDDPRKPSFAIVRAGTDISVRFAGIPMGHE